MHQSMQTAITKPTFMAQDDMGQANINYPRKPSRLNHSHPTKPTNQAGVTVERGRKRRITFKRGRKPKNPKEGLNEGRNARENAGEWRVTTVKPSPCIENIYLLLTLHQTDALCYCTAELLSSRGRP